MNVQTSHKIIRGDSRCMVELQDKSVHLVITSPPYWQLKDYGTNEQIGFNDSYERPDADRWTADFLRRI